MTIDLRSPLATQKRKPCDLVSADDPHTEVWFGPTCVYIKLIDLGVEVLIDSKEGNWSSVPFARVQAWSKLRKAFTPAIFRQMCEGLRSQGEETGKRDAKQNMRDALGL